MQLCSSDRTHSRYHNVSERDNCKEIRAIFVAGRLIQQSEH